ncbi:MAG: hypothetical protein WB421_05095 [Terriglobales bacterium]
MKRDDKALDSELEKLEETTRHGASYTGTDYRIIRPAVLLGLAVRKLDNTSTRLALANIILAAVLAIIGVVQICLMVRGH